MHLDIRSSHIPAALSSHILTYSYNYSYFPSKKNIQKSEVNQAICRNLIVSITSIYFVTDEQLLKWCSYIFKNLEGIGEWDFKYIQMSTFKCPEQGWTLFSIEDGRAGIFQLRKFSNPFNSYEDVMKYVPIHIGV